MKCFEIERCGVDYAEGVDEFTRLGNDFNQSSKPSPIKHEKMNYDHSKDYPFVYE